MKKKILFIILSVVLMLGVVFMGIGCENGDEERPLKIALIPGAEVLEEIEMYKPMVEYLGEQLGREIEFVGCTDYAAVVTALKTGSCDIARLGAFSYVLAMEEANVSIIVKGVRESTGTSDYYAYIITLPDSGIKTLEDIKGRTFAFVDVASTSGYLVPLSVFLHAGIDPETDFDATFAGSHAGVIEAVKNGQVDAGATCDIRINLALVEGVIEEDEIYIVGEYGPMPTCAFVVRGDMEESLKNEIQQAFLDMPTEICMLGVENPTEFVVAYDSDYDFVRQVAEELGIELGELE